MTDEDTVFSYLMEITQIRDQLTTNGEIVQDAELVNVALRGLPRSWEPFVQGYVHVRHFPLLIGYGLIVSKRRLHWCPGRIWMVW
jgi:hypothetical protein